MYVGKGNTVLLKRRRKETITFPKQKRLLHFAVGYGKIQGAFEFSISAFWISTVVCQ